MGFSSTEFLVTIERCFMNDPFVGCVQPPVAVVCQMTFAHLWEVLTLRLDDYKDRSRAQCMNHCLGPFPHGEVVSSKVCHLL